MGNGIVLPVTAAVEGVTDEAIVRALLEHCGRQAATIYVPGGKPHLLKKLGGFNAAAEFSPWLVVLDLDQDDECAPSHVARLLPSPSVHMRFRVAVRQAEAWLLADRSGIAKFLRVRERDVTSEPEAEPDAKESMLNLARKSSSRNVRNDMLPSSGSGRRTGPNYEGRIIEFATQHWNPAEASRRADSLRRCIEALAEPHQAG